MAEAVPGYEVVEQQQSNRCSVERCCRGNQACYRREVSFCLGPSPKGFIV